MNNTHPSYDTYCRLMSEVVHSGLCTHCGTCVGLAPDQLRMIDTNYGPLPQSINGTGVVLSSDVYDACPGKGLSYTRLNTSVFGKLPSSWLTGHVRQAWIGYSTTPEVRLQAASGGVITQTLLYLLEEGLIDGAVVLRQGWPKPWLASPIIACTPDEIIAASQSVYIPVPINKILKEMSCFDGRLAYVGLPDQVAALRYLQEIGHPGAMRVDYIIGPYVGTAFYLGAIVSFLHSNGIGALDEITELRYREGVWPGYLQIKTRAGKLLRADKFYYNYLIPFYITRSSLLSVDFTNELTDVSVGDAWQPQYEGRGGGYSVVLARSEKGHQLLKKMQSGKLIKLEEITTEDVLTMHGHMFDFKKRGAFVRIRWRYALGMPVPDYGYEPEHISIARYSLEVIISGLFIACSTRLARKLVEIIPLKIIGPVFEFLRRSWKQISKPTKRRGLGNTRYRVEESKL